MRYKFYPVNAILSGLYLPIPLVRYHVYRRECLQEYEQQMSPEAVFVKDLDRFDMIYQAFEYEQEEARPGELQDFYQSTNGQSLPGEASCRTSSSLLTVSLFLARRAAGLLPVY